MIIARFGEIFLKSKQVKKRFLNQLTNNIKENIDGEVSRKRLRLYIYPENEDKAKKQLKKTFGLVTFSPANRINPEIEEAKETGLNLTQTWNTGTFAVRAKRITKDYRFTSIDIEKELGAAIQNQTGLEVDLDQPKHILYTEFYGEDAYIFTEKIKAPGGLPLGVSGTLQANIKDKKDLMACWMMMKRGCLIKPMNKDSIEDELKTAFENWHITNKTPDNETQGTVTGHRKEEKIIEIMKNTNEPVYAPLTGLNQKETQKLEDKIFNKL